MPIKHVAMRQVVSATAGLLLFMALLPDDRSHSSAAAFASGEPTGPELAPRHLARADCLWLQARNHGFYQVQSDALDGIGGQATARLWHAFVDSVGVQACGCSRGDGQRLVPALAALRGRADRHFLAAR